MNVEQFLAGQCVQYDVIPHRSTFDAQRMAQTLHVPGCQIGKTVLLRADSGDAYIVAVLPATKSIDFSKASKALGGSKIELASEAEMAEHCPDCEIGVLPPFGSHLGMTTLVDKSLVEDEEIVFEGNRHDEAIRMKLVDFRRIEEPLVVSFATEKRKAVR